MTWKAGCCIAAALWSRGKTELCLGQVSGLAAVWLSHKHADHILGLLGILLARAPHDPPLLVSRAASLAAHARQGWAPSSC